MTVCMDLTHTLVYKLAHTRHDQARSIFTSGEDTGLGISSFSVVQPLRESLFLRRLFRWQD